MKKQYLVLWAFLFTTAIGTVAWADYQITTGTRTPLASFKSLIYSGVHYPWNIVAGLLNGSGAPTALNVDSSGRPQIVCASGCSGGGGGGAITAASGAYASGSIASGAFSSGSISAGAMVDIGTGASPAANTVNSNLLTLHTDLSTLNGYANSPVPQWTHYAPAQISVGSTATLIVASRTGRGPVDIVNNSTTDIFIGNTGVTTSTGQLLAGIKGQKLTIPFTGAIYGVVASGTATVTEAEVY